MKRGQPWLHIDLPKMKRGDGDRMADMCEQVGAPLVPWQRALLNRLESMATNRGKATQ